MARQDHDLQIQNLVMQISALTIALRHACKLVPGLDDAVRISARNAAEELGATTHSDSSIDALVSQLMIICGPTPPA
jgi:hypothetical protein